MSAVRKPTAAAKPDKTPAPAKATPKARKRVPAKQAAGHPLAAPVHEKLQPEFKDAQTAIFGAETDPRQVYKAGDRFVVRRWPDDALLDMERIVFGDQDLISSPDWVAGDDVEGIRDYIREARVCHVEFTIPVYLDVVRRSVARDHANKPVDPAASIWAQPKRVPPEPVTPIPEMRQSAAQYVGQLLYLRQFNEAERCIRAHRRVDDAETTWSSLSAADKNLLQALVQALDTIQEGVVPTKKDIRDKALKRLPDKAQTTRILNLSSLLACLPGAKPGPDPAKGR